jgi:preprotein translocase subunit SecG
MYIALISLILFICVLLVLVVLAQNSKGGGLSSQFGGGGTSQLMGVKRTGDLLEKLTWGFAIALMVLSLSSHAMLDTQPNTEPRSIIEERARGDRQVVPGGPVIPPVGDSAGQTEIPVAPLPEAGDTTP